MIRNPTGIDRLIILLTGKRQFRCRRCDFVFRAPDRRKTPRPRSVPAAQGKTN
jgi:hypothetical protein